MDGPVAGSTPAAATCETTDAARLRITGWRPGYSGEERVLAVSLALFHTPVYRGKVGRSRCESGLVAFPEGPVLYPLALLAMSGENHCP